MAIEKRYLKTKSVCKVTFRLPEDALESAESVHIIGDFNDWDREADPMIKLRDGTFKAPRDLRVANEYQFRYLLDHSRWMNDEGADKYVSGPYDNSENSMVIV